MRHHAFKQLKGVGSTANTVGYRSDLHLAAAAENMEIAAAWAIGSTLLGGESVPVPSLYGCQGRIHHPMVGDI